MWLQVVALLLGYYVLGDFISDPLLRMKRQDDRISDVNAALEFYHNCSCIYYYQCYKDGSVVNAGNGLITPRSRGSIIICEGGAFAGEFICCKNASGEQDKTPVNTEKPLITIPQPFVTQVRTCGKQLPVTNVRIFNDEEESIPVVGEFPWLVQLFTLDRQLSKWTLKGSGSLIHPRVVLTANHIVLSAKTDDLKVIVNGQIELGEIGENPEEERDIKEIVRHPQYSLHNYFNDIALLVLEEPYNITDIPYINTLCLRPNITYENKRCVVAGWGKDPLTNGTTKVLKKVELPALAHRKCQELLGKALNDTNYVFHESFMCAGGEEGKDACKGDGGSPLMCPTGIGHSLYQVGTVAWGIGCGRKDVPGAYSNIIHLHDWIDSKLRERDIFL